jgi:capsular exopolysaccharide synthesis family protein
VRVNTLGERDLVSGQYLSADDTEETLDLVRYWRAINRNKWRIAGLVGAIAVLAVLYAQSLQHVYRATATILVETSKPKVVSIEEVYSGSMGSYEYLYTQAGILQSRELAARVVRKLHLAQHASSTAGPASPPWYARFLPDALVSRPPQAPPSPEALEQALAGAVQGGIEVRPVRNSQLLQISFESHDPRLAAQVPNTLADLYITADMEARLKVRERAMAFLGEQSEALRKKLVASEKALQEFREREKILDVKGLSLGGATREIEQLTSALIEARRKRAEAEAALSQVKGLRVADGTAAVEALPAVLRNPLVQRAKDQEADAERRLADASKRYGSEHPRMIAAQAELRSAKENLGRQVRIVVASIQKEYEAARANEAATERALEQAKGDVQSLNRKGFRLAALEREVSTNRQLYDLFMQRSKETDVSSELQSAVARVIDPAVVPTSPSGPNKRRIVLIAVFMSLLLGMALAVLIERLDNTVKTSQDAEAKLGLPTVGVVHKTKVKRGLSLERLFLEDASTEFAEDIRTLRSGVLLSGLDSPQKTVLVTSSLPEEGKSTIAANLAFALSQVKKTLLIDADMRRPQIGQILGVPGNTPGLSSLVAGELGPDKCVFSVKGSELFVLPSGQIPANPLELLSAHRFAAVIEKLKDQFEAIVIDAAPVQMVSDPLVIAQVATAVLYVVKADETPFPVARQGIRRMRRVNAHILGIVLNQLDVAKAEKYYGEYSGYGRRYYRKYGYSKR